MIKSKLIDLLRTFSPKQSNRFKAFLSSPYFNIKDDLESFYSAILEFAPSFEDPNLSKAHIFELTFPKTKYDEKKMGYLMADLNKMAGEFLVHEAIKNDPIKADLEELEFYAKSENIKAFNLKSKGLETFLDKNEKRDSNFFLQQFRLQDIKNRFSGKNEKLNALESFDSATHFLDQFYLGSKLRYACAMLNSQEWELSNFELGFWTEIIQYLEKSESELTPFVEIYFCIFKCLTNREDDKQFHRLLSLLAQHHHTFGEGEIKELYTYAINYCISKINSGKQEFRQTLFDIYEDILNKGFLFLDGYLSPRSFTTVVSVATKINRFDWVENFIEKNAEYVRTDLRKSTVNYNLAYLHMEKGEFAEALEHLHQVSFKDSLYSLNGKSMLLKLYYELDEMEALYSLIDSFRLFVRRTKAINPNLREAWLNLIRFTKRLTKYRAEEKEKLRALEVSIKEATFLAGRQWIIQKVAEKIG